MKKVLVYLAQALICSALLSFPLMVYADQNEAPPAEQSVQADDNDQQLEQQLQNLDNYEPSNDMKQAVQELPDVE